MKTLFSKIFSRQNFRLAVAAVIAILFLVVGISPAYAQRDKKKKKDNTPPADSSNLLIPMSDEQQVDYLISEMLGAWQLGDIEKLHKDYADDVSVVSGVYAPPVIGWPSYLAAYQAQKARMQQVRYDRSNTFIRVNGNVAWACFQWDFAATIDGQPSESRGQTTLVFEKRNNRWVIVHNHTGLLETAQPQPAPANTQPTAPQQPAKTPSR